MGPEPARVMTGRPPRPSRRSPLESESQQPSRPAKADAAGEQDPRLRGRREQSLPPSGFTLMELLVSFTLIGLLAVFIHLGYGIGFSAREKAEAALQEYQANEAALDVISRQISTMVPYFSHQEHDGSPVEVLLFQATPQSLSFVSTYSAASRRTEGLMFVQYFTETSRDGTGRRLLLNERPLSGDAELLDTVLTGVSRTEDNRFLAELADPEVRPDSFTLARGLSSVAFQTFSRSREEYEGRGLGRRWTRTLGRMAARDRELLPAGIRMKLEWPEAGPYGSKEFAIAVPVQGQ